MIKKRTAILSLFMALVLFLAACSSSKTVPNESTGATDAVTTKDSSGMPEYLGNQAEKGAELIVYTDVGSKKFVDAIAADFKAKTGVTIKRAEEVSGEDTATRLPKEGPAGIGPDVIEFVHSQLGDLKDSVLPNDIFKQQTIDSMTEKAIAPVSYDGTLYGYPTSLETYVMFYNKDLMPQKPETWDQIKEFAKTFNDPSKNKFACMCAIQEGYMGFLFMAGNGGYVFGKNGTDITDIGLNNAGAIEGMEYYKSFKPFLPVHTKDVSRDIWRSLFAEGKTAMIVDGPWAMDSFVKANTGVTTLPKFPSGKDPGGFSGIKALYVSAYTKYPIAAKMFATYYSNNENSLKFYQMTKNPPANKSALASPDVMNDPVTSQFAKEFEYSIAQTSNPAFNAWWDVSDGIFSAIWDNNADVKKTLDDAVVAMKSKIAAMKK